jgi:spore coat polysaccharide biosynthesis protein SpsF
MINLAILKARTSSTRLPGKVLLPLNETPMIIRQIDRIMRCQKLDSLIVATSTDPSDNELVKLLNKKHVKVYRGSLGNVFSRYYNLTKSLKPRNVIRLTADCPLVMPELIDKAVNLFEESNADYISNIIYPTYPDGLDVEVMKSSAILDLNEQSLTQYEKEHVTVGLYNRPKQFKLLNFVNEVDLSAWRWTVDTKEDYQFVKTVYQSFAGREDEFNFHEVVELCLKYFETDMVIKERRLRIDNES